MRIPRIYHPEPLSAGTQTSLAEEAANHVGRVLRMSKGQKLALFDGSNQVFDADIIESSKKSVIVQVNEGQMDDRESPLDLHLGQVLSRTPLISERCGVKLDPSRLEKKHQQWQKIIISACEQCGRNKIPQLMPVMSLEAWCAQTDDSLKLNLHPRASQSINTLPLPVKKVRLLIGPEGGLSPEEIAMTAKYHFTDILLGPRVLRTETTALTAITALQVRFGDLG